MSEEYYQSAHTGLTIDNAISRIVNGELDKLAAGAANSAEAAQSALSGVQTAINNIPAGSTPIVNDLTTGGTQMALSAEMGKLLGQRPNPNLLDNWYFADPINQRGQTEYAGVGYGFDRWYNNTTATRCRRTDTGLHLWSESTAYSQIYQKLENPEQYFGKTLTFSLLRSDNILQCVTVTVPDAFQSTSTTLGSSGRCSVRLSTASFFVMISINTDPAYDIVAVKFEFGSIQTLAHQDSTGAWVLNDPPPNKQQELAKCQRHQVVYAPSSALTVAASSATRGSTYPNFALVLPTCLRATPSVSFSDLAVRNTHDGTTQEVTAVTLGAVSNNIVMLGVSVAAATDAGTDYSLRVLSGGKLILDANL